MSRLNVSSEIGPLRRVILHRPELSMQRLTPQNMQDLLFDDVIRVERAGKEHDTFSEVLRSYDVEVLLLHDLLSTVLDSSEARNWILERQVTEQNLGPGLARAVREQLERQDSDSVASALIGGVTLDDLEEPVATLSGELLVGDTDFVLPPLPNHLFMRDTSCWIFGGVSVNPMAMAARHRETVHLQAIYRFHPLFRDAHFDVWYRGIDMAVGGASIEGGDVLVIGNGTVLMGLSERTTPQAVEILALRLLRQRAAERVIVVELPKQRSCMHLDTVMTQMDVDCFSIYPVIIERTIPSFELTLGTDGMLKLSRVDDFYKALENALGVDQLRLITTGGDKYAAEREQWHDANNVLTVKPGTVIAYERNVRSIDKMQAAGITVVPIPGEELGRGRGGARCMSCPIERDDI
ncbi:MAG: arginine deiminase [Pseudomonadota bacterium]